MILFVYNYFICSLYAYVGMYIYMFIYIIINPGLRNNTQK